MVSSIILAIDLQISKQDLSIYSNMVESVEENVKNPTPQP